MTAELLPPIPRPPHDPTSILSNARVGWPVLVAHRASSASGALSLDRAPGSRSLVEPSGSFGGLRTPANVALDAGEVWLLDSAGPRLLRFDPCQCVFIPVPCFAGEGSGPRELLDPRAIAVCAGRLLVADAGNQRVAAFVLPALALAGHWSAPMDWQPTGIAADAAGTVYVADPRNGMVHRFTWRGRYLGHWDGFGSSTFLAIDRHGTVYAAGPTEAYRVGPAGEAILLPDVTGAVRDLAADFVQLPFRIDAAGRLHLGGMCAPPSAVAFDRHGNPGPPDTGPVGASHERSGAVTLGPYDSGIDGCRWHRVILRGELPDASWIELATLTSEIDLPRSQLDELPERSWETRLRCTSLAGDWDGLVLSRPGRFLWLRLELVGSGHSTPRIDSVEIEFPRVSLRRYLPAMYGAEPRSADFTDRFLALFDRQLRDVERTLDELAALFDPLSTPSLGWLAAWIGVVPQRQQPQRRQRELVRRWAETAALRGTQYGLRQLLVAYLGLDRLITACQSPRPPGSCDPPAPTCPPTPQHQWTWDPPPLILEHYRLRRWLELGAARLGDQAVLWGRSIVNRSQLGEGAQVGVTQLKATQDPKRDPFHVYAHRFTVFVPGSAGRTPEQRHALELLIASESPAHTEAHVEYVAARFRIGYQSAIGLDAVVARLPEGVTLGETPLGPASVLTGGATAAVDAHRIGSSAVLG